MHNPAKFSKGASPQPTSSADPAADRRGKRIEEAPFRQRLGEAFGFAADHNLPASLILVEVDRLSHLRETYGQQAGWAVLEHVDDVVRGGVRYEDAFLRCDNGVFGVIVAGANAQEAMAAAHRIRNRVESSRLDWEGSQVALTVSLGIATWKTGEVNSIDQLTESAELELSAAKAAGGNRIGNRPE